MKSFFLIIAIVAITIASVSCKSKAQKDAQANTDNKENTMKENNPEKTDDQQKANTISPNIPTGMESLIGEWKLDKILRDENGNHKIDDNEQNAVIESNNSIKLNADGTCKYETIMDGRYEITTEEDGRKRLIYYDMSGTQYPMKLYINSVNKDELVININNAGGSQFEIYKRP
jgi:hypothetical protein